ncbi:succinylglutamate desuccinylase/aspartoacylase family protein [Catalinimonas sp. 4WD22]|uniref:succinylglutamate desuccinylase/aspartoacylase family protein n=1 Tax=Catalinimonas locisalis TaxID=3133978 RepID=UPI0031017821
MILVRSYMVQVNSKALNQSLNIGRLIGQLKSNEPGPTLIFTGGIHGNEPAGIFALDKVLKEIKEQHIQHKGNIYAISGNLWALERGVRYHREDLNRLWTSEKMEDLLTSRLEIKHEDIAQQKEIYRVIREILDTEEGPFYFIDLHTTSSQTTPFLTVNDSLLNRKFTTQYPVPMILGIEEYLDGPLLSYINALGYVAFGYEGGQHDASFSVESMVSFIYLTLVFSGSIEKQAVDFEHYYQFLLNASKASQGIYEIFSRHEIKTGETFRMKEGFSNFQEIQKGEALAESDGKTVGAASEGKIFMPLYQSQGNDGFFLIRKIPPVFLQLSAFLRKFHFDHVLPLLPGVRWLSDQHDALRVNQNVARFFARQFFHLLGYRSRQLDKNHLIMKNREAASREQEYQHTIWYKR